MSDYPTHKSSTYQFSSRLDDKNLLCPADSQGRRCDLGLCLQVEYQCEAFLEKNKDTVNEEQINVLKQSKVS